MSKLKKLIQEKESVMTWLKAQDTEEAKTAIKILEEQDASLKYLQKSKIESYNDSVIYFEIAKEVMGVNEIEATRLQKIAQKEANVIYH